MRVHKNVKFFYLIAIFIASGLMAFFYMAFSYTSQKRYVSIVDNSIVYDGGITKEGAEQLIAHLKKTKNNHFYINSRGGSSEAGMEIGDFVSKNNIAVIVIGDCHSSCANYVFLPSKNRKAVANAQIGMHGGYASYEYQRRLLLEKIPSEHRSMYEKTFIGETVKIENEKNLLSNAGVNPEIINKSAQMTYYGEASLHLISDGKKIVYAAEKIISSNFELWFPPLSEYGKWGVKIEFISSPEFTKQHSFVNANIPISRQSTAN